MNTRSVPMSVVASTQEVDVAPRTRSAWSELAHGVARDRDASVPTLRWIDHWRVARGGGITIALLDTAFDRTANDLKGASIEVRDFATGDTPPALHCHGAHALTLLMAQGREQLLGLAPGAHLLAARVVGATGIAEPASVAAALDWAIARGAWLAIVPFADTVDHPAITRAMTRCEAAGVCVLAAAGNAHPAPLAYPARLPSVIAVGALAPCGLLPTTSRVPRLDLAAPGWAVPALIGGQLHVRSGTSVACTVAGGVAALALAAHRIRADRRGLLSLLASTSND